jgi:uncharacterized protein (TIGR03000 family)
VVVSLPDDAQLTINGKQMVSTSAKRTFYTSNLKQGKKYTYTIKARFKRNGKVQTVTKKVKVRAGRTTQVKIQAPATFEVSSN